MNTESPGGGEQPQGRGDLGDAIQALITRLTDVAKGPEAQRVKAELENGAQDIARQIDQALDGPQAQALKERVAALIRTVQEHLK